MKKIVSSFIIFIIASFVLAFIVVATKDTHKTLSEVLDKAIVYISLLGIPFILYIISTECKNILYSFSTTQKKYWQSIKKISLSERENVPFPVDIDIEKGTEEIINELIGQLEKLEENTNYCISKLSDENHDELFECINLSIPNNCIDMRVNLYKLIILSMENTIKLNPSESTLEKIEKYKDILKNYIEDNGYID